MSELELTCPTSTVTTSGISLEEHETIDSLVHSLSETGFVEIIRNVNGKVTSVNALTAPAGTDVRSVDITRNIQGKVIETVETQADEAGSSIQTLTTTITRGANGKVESVTTTEVGP